MVIVVYDFVCFLTFISIVQSDKAVRKEWIRLDKIAPKKGFHTGFLVRFSMFYLGLG